MKPQWKHEDIAYYTLKTKKFTAEIFLANKYDTEWQWTVGNQDVYKIGSAKTRAEARRIIEEFGKTITCNGKKVTKTTEILESEISLPGSP